MAKSNLQKYRITQITFTTAFFLAGFCLLQMYKAGPDEHRAVIFWFTLLLITVAIGLPFGIAFYYYRVNLKNVDPGWVEVSTLAAAARTTPTPAHTIEPAEKVEHESHNDVT